MKQQGWRLTVKELFDRTAALLGLIFLSPLLASVALVVWVSMGAPVLFRQVRPGLRSHPFEVLKFRTMVDRRSADGRLLSDEGRLTRAGRFLRGLSLDELPQLWSVLRGDLSLVGPRPLLSQYLERYTPEQAHRHDVLPGITGWAQVNGRNALSWEEKFMLDVWYVDHWSLSLDFKILFSTLWHIVKRTGISKDGFATMPEFTGSNTHQRKGSSAD
jgi:lipopolysaccharide/colanic/teichoic acid biosynthesis glycosyltransferase